jgi:hypothetical protein
MSDPSRGLKALKANLRSIALFSRGDHPFSEARTTRKARL